jgi:hypothetical protein
MIDLTGWQRQRSHQFFCQLHIRSPLLPNSVFA